MLLERLTEADKAKLAQLQAQVRLRRRTAREQPNADLYAPLLPTTSRRPPPAHGSLPRFLISRHPSHATSRFNRRTRLHAAHNRGRRRTTTLLSIFVTTLLFLLGVAAVAGAFGYSYFLYQTRDLPSVENIASLADSFRTSEIYDRNGTLLYQMSEQGKRTYKRLPDISPYVVSATLAAEDPTFYANQGVDTQGIIRAVYINVSGQGQAGGSTITQQLVRRVLLPEKDERSFERKLREAVLAVRLTERYSKNEILEIYLNQIYYGQLSYGIAAAADTYYNRPARDLTLAQAAMLAGIPQLPERNPFKDVAASKERQQHVLELMVKFGYASPTEAAIAMQEDVTPLAHDEGNTVAPHFVNYVRDVIASRYTPEQIARGLLITTTLDLRYQQLAQQQVAAQVVALADQNATNGALVAIQPQTGEILAMVGSVNYNQPGWGQYNVTTARRQPGSAFKPFAYALALRKGYTPATVLADVTTPFANGDGNTYTPSNYDNRENGPVSLRIALARSLNIPAVKILQYATISETLALAQSLGLYPADDTPADYGLAMVLGGSEVRLLDLTAAYASFANAGDYLPPSAILKVTDADGNLIEQYTPAAAPRLRAFSPEEAYLISDILSDNTARAGTFGEQNALQLSRPAAAKTGTTNDYRDNWTVGYTPDLVTGVWLGNNDNSPLARVAGARGAAPIWQNFMEGVYARPELTAVLQVANQPAPVNFTRPLNIVDADVCVLSGMKPGQACRTADDVKQEKFIAGREPTQEDTIYKLVRICKLPGAAPCQANPYCPLELVAVRAYPQLPAEYKQWAADKPGMSIPPVCTAPGPPKPQPVDVPTLVTDAPALPVVSDTVGLQLAITAPASGSIVRGIISVQGSAAGEGFRDYRLAYGSAAAGPWLEIDHFSQPVTGGFLANWNSDQVPEGAYLLRLTVTTADGQERHTYSSVRVARSRPTVTLTAPLTGSKLQPGRKIWLAASAENAAQVIFLVDGVPVAYANAAPWQVEWPVLAGDHTITAQAKAASGAVVESAGVSYSAIPDGFTADGQPLEVQPTAVSSPVSEPSSNQPANLLRITSPSPGSYIYVSNITLQASVDGNSPIDEVRFSVDGSEIGTARYPYTLDWPTVEGDHEIAARGYYQGREIARSSIRVLVKR